MILRADTDVPAAWTRALEDSKRTPDPWTVMGGSCADGSCAGATDAESGDVSRPGGRRKSGERRRNATTPLLPDRTLLRDGYAVFHDPPGSALSFGLIAAFSEEIREEEGFARGGRLSSRSWSGCDV